MKASPIIKNNPSEYRSYNSMKCRCYQKSHVAYIRYSARGITVCQRWLQSFDNFFADMGSKPTPKHSLERKNNDLGYFPENCVWADRFEQGRNKTTNSLYTYKGETKCIAAWAEQYGLRRDTLRFRLVVSKWPIEKCLKQKSRDMKREVEDITTGLRYGSPMKAAKALGIDYGYVKYHLNVRKVNETNLRYVG